MRNQVNAWFLEVRTNIHKVLRIINELSNCNVPRFGEYAVLDLGHEFTKFHIKRLAPQAFYFLITRKFQQGVCKLQLLRVWPPNIQASKVLGDPNPVAALFYLGGHLYLYRVASKLAQSLRSA